MLVLIGQRTFPGWKARMLDGNQRRLATTKAATAHRVRPMLLPSLPWRRAAIARAATVFLWNGAGGRPQRTEFADCMLGVLDPVPPSALAAALARCPRRK